MTDDKSAPEHPAPWAHLYCPVCHTKWAFFGCEPGKCGLKTCRACGQVMPPKSERSPLFNEMEELLREMYESQAIVMDGETDEACAHRRNGMRRGFDKIGPLLARIGGAK